MLSQRRAAARGLRGRRAAECPRAAAQPSLQAPLVSARLTLPLSLCWDRRTPPQPSWWMSWKWRDLEGMTRESVEERRPPQAEPSG